MQCGRCRHLKEFLNHPKYGVIEIDRKKNFELMSKLINEVFEQSYDMPYSVCVIGYLDKARRRVQHGFNCDRYKSRTAKCWKCGEIIDTGF